MRLCLTFLFASACVFGEELDTIYYYNDPDISDNYPGYIMGIFDEVIYFQIDSEQGFKVREIQFQIISDYINWSGPLPKDESIYFIEGVLDTLFTDSLELWPNQNTGNPEIDILSALPGEDIASINFTLTDTSINYPNWTTINLDTIQELQYFSNGIWVRSNLWFITALDTNRPWSNHVMNNHQNAFWSTSSFDKAVRLIVELLPLKVDNRINYSDIKTNINIYPNPTNENINIQITTFDNIHYSITIFDIIGKKVFNTKTEFNGTKTVRWNGIDNYGKKVASGVYYILIKYNNGEYVNNIIKKMILLK